MDRVHVVRVEVDGRQAFLRFKLPPRERNTGRRCEISIARRRRVFQIVGVIRFGGQLRPPDIRDDGGVVRPLPCRAELGNGDRRENADNDRDDEQLDQREAVLVARLKRGPDCLHYGHQEGKNCAADPFRDFGPPIGCDGGTVPDFRALAVTLRKSPLPRYQPGFALRAIIPAAGCSQPRTPRRRRLANARYAPGSRRQIDLGVVSRSLERERQEVIANT